MSDETYAEVDRRLQELLADPFGLQVLRETVPRGKQISVALTTDRAWDAVRRAMHDSHGLPAYLAVGLDLTLVIVEPSPDPGDVVLTLAGDWGAPSRPRLDPDATLGEVIAVLRGEHDDQN